MTDANIDLVAERLDLAVRLGPRRGTPFIRSKLFDTHYRVVASPGYTAEAGPLPEPAALETRDCVLFPFPDYRSKWRFKGPDGRIATVSVQGRLIISNAGALRQAVLAGLGPALLADWLIGDDVREGRLIDLFPACRVTAADFETAAWLLYPSRSFLPLKVRAVIDFLRAELRPFSLGPPSGQNRSDVRWPARPPHPR